MPEIQDRVIVSAEPVGTDPDFFSINGLLRLVRRNGKLMGSVMGAIALGSVAMAFLVKSTYTAATTIMPPQQNRSIASALLSQIGAASMLLPSDASIKDPNDVFVVMLQSRSIADALIEENGLQSVYRKARPEDLRSALAERTHIKSGKGGVITVAVDDSSPTRAAALANAYVAQLYRLNTRIAVTEAGQRRTFFENQYQLAERELSEAQERFKNTQQSTGIVQLDAQAKGIVEGASALQEKLAAKEVEVRAMQSYATEENPRLQLAQKEVAALREQLAKVDIHRRAGTIDVPISELPSATMEYATSLRDVKYKEAVLEAVGKQLEVARIDEAKDAPLIQVIDAAVPPTKPSGPNRLAIIVAGIFSGFVIATAWVIGREYLRSGLPPLTRSRRESVVSEWD